MTLRCFRSFAKINLGLEVVGKLPSGYHELKTIFATVSLHDIVEIAETRKGITVNSDHPDVPSDETNLAHRAAALMQHIAGRKTGVSIRVRKRIAVGAGLGGGSSNAATVLRALDVIWGLGLGADRLVEAAKTLGADVPYFLVGGPANGLGRGDNIQPLNVRLSQRVLLVPGQSGLSTAAVFRRFAELTATRKRASRIDPFLLSIKPGRRNPEAPCLDLLRNDLERVALLESPSLAIFARQIRDVGRATGALQTAMTGSGSSFFLLFDVAESRRTAAAAFGKLGIPSIRCSFLSRSTYLSRFEIKAR